MDYKLKVHCVCNGHFSILERARYGKLYVRVLGWDGEKVKITYVRKHEAITKWVLKDALIKI